MVRGWLHEPAPSRKTFVVRGRVGSDASLLIAIAETFSAAGLHISCVCNLPFRQERPTGPPLFTPPNTIAKAQCAPSTMQKSGVAAGPLILGGHSYGGRQSSMLAAEHPGLADMLLLLAYPLPPPTRSTTAPYATPSQLREPRCTSCTALAIHLAPPPRWRLRSPRRPRTISSLYGKHRPRMERRHGPGYTAGGIVLRERLNRVKERIEERRCARRPPAFRYHAHRGHQEIPTAGDCRRLPRPA